MKGIVHPSRRKKKRRRKRNRLIFKSPVRLSFLVALILLLAPRVHAEEFVLRTAEHLFDVKGPKGLSLSLPTDVVVDRKGNIYVLDGVHNSVKVFDRKGRFLRKFGRLGNTKGGFDTPVGIGIDSEDNIYVCDTKNGRIVVFKKTGEFVRDLVLKPEERGMAVPRPVDISVDDDRGLLYITDNANHMVLVYTKAGAFIRTWGGRGVGEDEFRYPATLTFMGPKLFVVDVLGTRLQVINIETGVFAGQIGRWGVLPGEFFRPKGVAVDRDGFIYVTDSYMDVIQGFTEFGELVFILGDENDNIRRFTSPASIFIDDTNRLYVVEMLKNKVGVYQLK